MTRDPLSQTTDNGHRNGKAYFGQSRPASRLEYDLATGMTRRCGTVGKDYYLGIQSFAEDSAGRL